MKTSEHIKRLCGRLRRKETYNQRQIRMLKLADAATFGHVETPQTYLDARCAEALCKSGHIEGNVAFAFRGEWCAQFFYVTTTGHMLLEELQQRERAAKWWRRLFRFVARIAVFLATAIVSAYIGGIAASHSPEPFRRIEKWLFGSHDEASSTGTQQGGQGESKGDAGGD